MDNPGPVPIATTLGEFLPISDWGVGRCHWTLGYKFILTFDATEVPEVNWQLRRVEDSRSFFGMDPKECFHNLAMDPHKIEDHIDSVMGTFLRKESTWVNGLYALQRTSAHVWHLTCQPLPEFASVYGLNPWDTVTTFLITLPHQRVILTELGLFTRTFQFTWEDMKRDHALVYMPKSGLWNLDGVIAKAPDLCVRDL